MRPSTLLAALLASLLSLPAFAAGPPTCPNPILSIFDVQNSVDGGSPTGASLCAGQAVALTGIVYADYGPSFAFADAAGAWNGLYIYNPNLAAPALGDEVTVSGTISEFNGVTEIAFPTSVVVNSSGNTPYAPSVVSTLDVSTGAGTAESYEGVLVEVQNVTVTDESLGFGEWQIDDTSGPTRVDDLAPYCYRAALGDPHAFIRGMLHYSFDNFKIEPRDDCDFSGSGCAGGSPTLRTIPTIQGTGFTSPHVSELVETTGVVTGLFEGNYPGFTFFDGFFLQDAAGDANDATSDGIFVISTVIPAIGTEVTVSGLVGEFNEFDGTACLDGCTTMVCATQVTLGAAQPAVGSTTWAPPTDNDQDLEYHESKEGMLVSIPGDAAVVGPTSFGALFVVDSAEGVDRVLRDTAVQGKQVGVRHWELFGDINGSDADNLIVGSVVQEVDGPLTTSFGDPLIITQAGDPWSTVSSAPLPSPPPFWSDAFGDRFAIATLNVENFDDGDTTKLSKMVDMVTRMGCPTFLALEEVDTASTLAGDQDEVLTEIKNALTIEGCTYDSGNSHPDVGDHGVAILWRPDQVSSASWHADVQGCSTAGSSSSPAYDDFCDSRPSEFPLFSRRPVFLTAQLNHSCASSAPIEVTIVANHFKSKLGGAPADQRRLEQGQLVATTVDNLVAGGSDFVIVLGDLNDFLSSPPVDALTASGELSNLWDEVAVENRYSYIFSGVSQILDHQLASTALLPNLIAVSPLHFDADYPGRPYGDQSTNPWALSDHDPVIATFGSCENGVIFVDGFESGDLSAWSSTNP